SEVGLRFVGEAWPGTLTGRLRRALLGIAILAPPRLRRDRRDVDESALEPLALGDEGGRARRHGEQRAEEVLRGAVLVEPPGEIRDARVALVGARHRGVEQQLPRCL